jgi:hypothetical protein
LEEEESLWLCRDSNTRSSLYRLCELCLLKHFVEGQMENYKGKEDDEDVSSYWMNLTKRKDMKI